MDYNYYYWRVAFSLGNQSSLKLGLILVIVEREHIERNSRFKLRKYKKNGFAFKNIVFIDQNKRNITIYCNMDILRSYRKHYGKNNRIKKNLDILKQNREPYERQGRIHFRSSIVGGRWTGTIVTIYVALGDFQMARPYICGIKPL